MNGTSSQCLLLAPPPALGVRWQGDQWPLLAVSLGMVVLVMILSLLAPGERRARRVLAHFVVAALLVIAGFMLQYGVAQPWYDAMNRWSHADTSISCEALLLSFTQQSTWAATYILDFGLFVMCIGLWVGVVIPFLRPVAPGSALAAWLRHRPQPQPRRR